MNGKTWFSRTCAAALAAVVGAQLWTAARLWAFPEAARQTKSACVACHSNPAGGAELSEAGKAFKAEAKPPAAAAGKKADYVGAARCRMCHLSQHKSWAETPHAKAFTKLAAADAKATEAMAAKLKVEIKGSAAKTDGCVKCHVTGFQLTGGYPQADSAKAAALAAVGCESCHGPGSLHVTAPMAEKKKVITRASAATCKQCHTPALSPDFDFAEYSKRGVHAMTVKKAGG